MASLAQRSFQVWPLLVLAARRRHLLTYEEVEVCTGIQRQSLGQFLDPIAEYCLRKKLPPITILVVKKDTGVPGSGFRAHEINTAEKFAQALATVFLEDWNKKSPKLEDLGPGCNQVGQIRAKARGLGNAGWEVEVELRAFGQVATWVWK